MPLKRKRRVSLTSKGLAPGEQLKRSALPGTSSLSWSWVGTDVVNSVDITNEHRLVTCGLSKRNKFPFCHNKYSIQPAPEKLLPERSTDENEMIVISDDEELECNPKRCKSNPNCLNYLGQDEWENEDNVMNKSFRAANLGDNPILNEREPDYPVGLKNLGATCYANASIQVWFRDLKFRSGVYTCQRPPEEAEEKFEDSPIFQLQVTFAALQESTQSVFNPTRLVESLQLRTTEQQDAQEFSKLFMSHLDTEFKKQTIPAVKCLITDQFQGKQIYGTMCNHCHYRSERISDFLEIEINLTSNSRLEDRISALLEPEILSGDNQYLCSQCDSLRDATRYTELRELPPVLHFSLLRFVYDVSAMERKKSKHTVTFPISLDMSKFLGSTNQVSYELSGILLHKGPSAYHGHYEAQVYDAVNESWFQFNDEVVTKIISINEGRSKHTVVSTKQDNEELLRPSQARKSRTNDRKRRRVDDKDNGSVQTISPEHTHSESKTISSKDAYMLIYSRKEPASVLTVKNDQTPSLNLVPPARALKVVNSLNAAHDEGCDVYNAKENLVKSQFQQRRREVMEIYRTWNIRSMEEPSVIVSQQALKKWFLQYNEPLSAESINGPLQDHGEAPPQRVIHLDDILCSHQRLDPTKAGNIKRICEKAYTQIVRDTGYVFQPNLTTDDVCVLCVKQDFNERLYQIEHPRLVSEFDRISEVALDSGGYWISKLWLKDWKLMKPKMHIASESDPAPDSPEFAGHVKCEHQGLSLNITSRRKISAEGTRFLQRLYPSWDPIPTDAEVCPVCDALIHISKEDKRGIRRRAENERALLRHMHDHASAGNAIIPENEPYAIISASFLKMWHQWLDRPTGLHRPDTVDNTPFVCEHDLLNFDPNSRDFDSSFSLVKRADWDTLEKFYPGGPLISVERRSCEDATRSILIHDIAVCITCRTKKISDWTTAEIVVRLGGTGTTSENTKKLLTYTSKAGARQSKRLRQIKELGERNKLTITKSTTVNEIKIMLQDVLNIPTICQKLFYQGQELKDNSATVRALHIYANDTLDLQEQSEVIEINSDGEEKKPRDEGRGFGGTLLGSSPNQIQGSDGYQQPSKSEKACSTCTFFNDQDASSCTICDTVFIR